MRTMTPSRVARLFLIASLTLGWFPHPSLGHVVRTQYQTYSDSNEASITSQILQYRNNFYFFSDPTYLTYTSIQYKHDHSQTLEEPSNHAHGFDLGLTQAFSKSTRATLQTGYSFDPESHLYRVGSSFEQGFFNDNLSTSIGWTHVGGRRPVTEFLKPQELVPVTTSDVQLGNDFFLATNVILSTHTMGRLGWRYVTRNERASAQVASARLHQWLPTRGSIQAEYSYFWNVGDIPRESQVGRLNAHIVNLGLYQYLADTTIVGLSYRFYNEREAAEPGFSNIIGSDLYGVKLTQDLLPWLRSWSWIQKSSIDDVQLEMNLQRYLNNQGNQAWIASLGTNLSF